MKKSSALTLLLCGVAVCNIFGVFIETFRFPFLCLGTLCSIAALFLSFRRDRNE